MTEVAEIQVRMLDEQEIEHVERTLTDGPPEKHRQRLALQQQGSVVYLIAWAEGAPVGHLLLKWGGTSDEPMASSLQFCPDIEDLYVAPDYRANGVGSLLLDFAEHLAQEAGYRHIGLGVGIDNQVARGLYENRGYRYSGLGEYLIGGRYIDRQGRQRIWKETCVYLIKDLAGESLEEPGAGSRSG